MDHAGRYPGKFGGQFGDGQVGGMGRLFDDAARHQRPAEADRDAAEDALERAEFHRVGDRVAARPLPCDGAAAVGAALAEQDQRLDHRVAAPGADLDEFLDDQFDEIQFGMDHRAGDEGAVELVGQHAGGQRGAGVGLHARLEPRVRAAHRLQRRRQVQCGEGLHRADAQFADAFAGLADRGAGLPLEQQHAARVVEQHAAGRRQFQAASLAEEEFGAQFLLEPADAAGYIGLDGVQLARRGEDAAFLDDRLEGAQGEEFHNPFSIGERFVLNNSFVWIG